MSESEKALMDLVMENPEDYIGLGFGVIPMAQTKLDRKYWPGSTDEMLNDVLEKSKHMLATEGSVHPIFITYHVDAAGDMHQTVMAIGAYMRNESTKAFMAQTIRDLCQNLGPFATFFVSEAWTVEAPKETSEDSLQDEIMNHPEVRKTGSLGDHPDRKEVLMVNVETSDGCVHHNWEILRDGDFATLGEYKVHDTVEGRFAGFLERSPF